jgi:NADPH:quinone reductase-like Zn-dependent oxidoreductase
MRAAMITTLGEPPELRELPVRRSPPEEGDVLIEVECVPLNPIDIAVGAGRFYGGHPDLPYVPGEEAVGRRSDTGERVWAYGRWIGGLQELVHVRESRLTSVPEGADPAIAAACGIGGISGWLPVTWRAPVSEGDRVLVLGATGTVGLVALQAAKLRGAARVVAAGRDAEGLERARRAGADDVVTLDAGDDLVERLRSACGGDGPTYVVDPLWGAPVAAAAEACARHARIVHLGQSAGPEATLKSSVVRGKALDLHGHSTPFTPRDVLRREYAQLVRHVMGGQIEIEVERVPFEQLADAWRRQAEGSPKRKLVILVQSE